MKFAIIFGIVILSYCCIAHANSEPIPENRVRRAFDDVMKV